VIWQRGTIEPTTVLWVVLLFVQALPFLAALVMSMINVLPVFKWNRAPSLPPVLPRVIPGELPSHTPVGVQRIAGDPV
jgi:hypothetical protein